MTVYLSVDRVIELHGLAAGSVPIIDRATLEGAVARCQAGFGGEDAFPRVVDKAAALLHGIASTQCFQDGNKRAAWLATVVFLELNGVDLPEISDIEAEAFVMAVAVSAWPDRTVEKAAEWLQVQAEQPRRHPQLDFATLARGASADEDGTYSLLHGDLAAIAAPFVPFAIALWAVCRVFWRPVDEGRSHTVTAQVFPEGGDEPVAGNAWTFVPPVRGGHSHHPHGLMPSVTALQLVLLVEEPGRYRVVLDLDGTVLTELPLNVVVSGLLS